MIIVKFVVKIDFLFQWNQMVKFMFSPFLPPLLPSPIQIWSSAETDRLYCSDDWKLQCERVSKMDAHFFIFYKYYKFLGLYLSESALKVPF